MPDLPRKHDYSRLTAEREAEWIRLAKLEPVMAGLGGHTWSEYVRTCEITLAQSWSYIRVRFGEIHEELGTYER
jgi:hypothetical protein